MKIAASRLLLLLAGAALSFSVSAGQLYKWTDANGRVQYSDTPPTNQAVEQLKGSRIGGSSGPASAPAEVKVGEQHKENAAEGKTEAAKGTPKTIADQEQAFRKRQQEKKEAEEKQAKEDADKKTRADNCLRAKEYITSLDNGRIRSVNEKGEYVFFDDAKIASEKERTRKQIAELCK